MDEEERRREEPEEQTLKKEYESRYTDEDLHGWLMHSSRPATAASWPANWKPTAGIGTCSHLAGNSKEKTKTEALRTVSLFTLSRLS